MAMETVIPNNLWRWLAVAATLISALAIVGTYHVFSQTYDEPAHLASGIEYLSKGQYRYEAQHPPLARIMLALGPYARGVRTIGKINQFYEGQLLLGEGAEYRTRLALARLGELPFFILICLFTWLWGRRLLGEAGAALGVLFVATNPNLLAHAGLATTDIAPAAAMVAVLYMYALWRQQPTTKRAIILGMMLGLAAVTKFSVIAFLGVALVGAELWFRLPTLRRPRSLGIIVLCTCVVVWSIYRFSFGPIGKTGVPVPAPEFFAGLAVFLSHGTGGHPAFLLGSHSMTGWWYYFPVAIAVKTPLPILVFALLGCMAVVKEMRADRSSESALLLIGIAGVLLIGMMTKVDIGIRHVLPLYPMLALVAARGVIELWREVSLARQARFGRAAVALLAASTVFITARAYPDFLPYFNPIAGDHPERVLVDSNLDWGQDLYRLATVVEKMHLDSVRVAYFGSADIRAAGVPNARRLHDHERAAGWVAASQTMLAGVWVDTSFAWLNRIQPVGRVGPSLLLYFVTPKQAMSGLPGVSGN